MPVQMIVYGQSGIGKTVFLGSVSSDNRTMPALFLDVDRSTMSIASKLRYVKLDQIGLPVEGKIDCLTIGGWSDFQRVYDFLFSVRTKDKMGVYKSLIIDTLTEVHYICLEHVRQADINERLDPDIPQIHDYGKASVMMKKMLRGLRDLPDLHLFYSCQPKLLTDSVTDLAAIKPSFVGQLADEAVAIVPIIGYMKVGNKGEREMLWQPKGKVLAKDRTEGGLLGDRMESPTVTKVLDLILGKEA